MDSNSTRIGPLANAVSRQLSSIQQGTNRRWVAAEQTGRFGNSNRPIQQIVRRRNGRLFASRLERSWATFTHDSRVTDRSLRPNALSLAPLNCTAASTGAGRRKDLSEGFFKA